MYTNIIYIYADYSKNFSLTKKDIFLADKCLRPSSLADMSAKNVIFLDGSPNSML